MESVYPIRYHLRWLRPDYDYNMDTGRFVDMGAKANCDIEPVLLDAPNAPESPEPCDANQNANAGTALPGEGFSGPLVGGSLSLQTPFGEISTGVVGSSIAFRRSVCEADTCQFTLTDLTVDVEDFDVGPFIISDVHAELVGTAIGIVRGDTTATIDDGGIQMQVTLGVSVKAKNLFGGKLLFSNQEIHLFAANEGPVTMIIDTDNNISIVEASFVFPSNIHTRLTTTSTNCALEPE
jgi:hypothetical protein